MLRIACLTLLLTAFPALADPGYYRVTGVASDDTLNVRVEPSGSSADIGDLPHDATGIEVITQENGWGQIVWEEGNGWISMRFLEPDDTLPMIAGTDLPVGLLCGGTEPFWSIRLSGDSATYSDTSGTVLPMTLVDARVSSGRPGFPLALRFTAEGAGAMSIIRAQVCWDGMSDRTYGYALTQLLRAGSEERFLDGCCWLPLEIGAH